MPRKVYIERNRLSSLISESTEEGTYKIGMEPGAPVGGEYYHVVDDDAVNEASNVYANGDLSYMDYIEYIPHDNPMEEDIDEPYYEVEAFDNDGNRIFYGDLTFDELYDYFDENVIHMITNRGGRKVSQVAYRIDDLLSYNTKVNDINNVEEVNAIAKKIQTNYGQSSFILTDGDVVSFADHSNIATIDGMTIAKFVSLGNIRVGAGGSIEVAKMPTREQFRELKLFVRNNDGNVYLDISEDTGQFYSHVICSATYKNAKPDRVVNDIYYYFEEGVKPQGGMYESKMVKENIEDEVESSEVDLSSFEKRDSLPSIWKDDDTLDSKVRLKLLDIADDFWEYVDITWVEPVGIIITGSLCNYNWSEFSDVDLHLIVNFNEIDERVDFVRQYLDSKKNEWNEEHGALKIYGYPVELYVQNIDEDVNAGGVYDLEENKWIRKPSYDDMEEIGTESDDIKEKAARVMTIIDDMCDYFNTTDDSHKLEILGDDAKRLWDKIKEMRKNGLAKDGEMSIGNIIYKYMRRKKYLDKLFDLRTAIYDKTNTITEGVSYDRFRDGQAFRYRVIASMVKDGYLFHGTDNEWDEFDQNRIKGEERAVYGYGAYFTNAAYKCEEYGNHFVILDSNGFNFLNIKEKVHPGYNIFKEKIMDYYKIEHGLDSARNNREYDNYSNLLDEYRSSIDNGKNKLLERFIEIIEKRGFVDYNELNKLVDYSFLSDENGDIQKRISELYLALGYDGFVCENQFVVFNFEKLNKNLVKDKEALISKYTEEQLSEVKEYIKVLKDFSLNEEVVADGNSEHNPYAKRWKAERDALKNFLSNFGQIMTSRENGKQYKCYFDKSLSDLIGYNYCICIQWDPIKLEVGATPYIRAFDKFTTRIFQAQFDDRGRDNLRGTSDDVNCRPF